nr:uncharacterized protein LOC112997267 [Dromaius novaehollandiae]
MGGEAARPEQSNKSAPRCVVGDFTPATAGSAGLDLAVAHSVTITTTDVILIPTGVWGPIGKGMHTLLIGRSSTTKLGLFILPGVIDSDYNGEIQIMAWTPVPPCFVPQGQRITQLVPFRGEASGGIGYRGEKGFGSTGTPQALIS